MFIKIICSNGFCSCDEEFFEIVNNEEEADELTEEAFSWYGFAEPDGRFCDMDDEEAIEEYYENLSAWWEEISEEEFRENT